MLGMVDEAPSELLDGARVNLFAPTALTKSLSDCDPWNGQVFEIARFLGEGGTPAP
jgi:hypothetical protein